MKAAVLQEIPGQLVIDDVQIDKPGPREVLIKTSAAGCCHSDLHFMEGKYPYPTPAVLGHESAGIVEAVGSDVTYVKPGDHVITCLSVFCGQCDYCIAGKPNLCTKDATRRPFDQPQRLSKDGAPVFQFLDLSSFAEQMLVHEGAVVKIRDDMPLDRAALIGCGVTPGLGAVLNTAGVRAGESAVVVGCGGVGQAIVLGLALVGASPIVAVDLSQDRLDHARELGATHALRGDDPELVRQVRRATRGGADHAFDAIGRPETLERLPALVRAGGEGVIVGMPAQGTRVAIDPLALASSGKRLVGCHYGSSVPAVDFPRLARLYLDGRLPLDRLVGRRTDLDGADRALADLRAGIGLRTVLEFGNDTVATRDRRAPQG